MTKEIKLGGFRFTKQSVERNENFKGEVKVSPNMNIKSIEKFKSENIKKESLKVEFKFEVDYGELGKVFLEGFLFLITDPKTQKEALDSWKNKKLDNDINLIILNIIMQKASIKAMSLEEEFGLPLHVQIPRLQLGKKE